MQIGGMVVFGTAIPCLSFDKVTPCGRSMTSPPSEELDTLF